MNRTHQEGAMDTSHDDTAKGADARGVLECRGITVHFKVGRRQTVKAVDGIDLTVKDGETVGLIGESGSGKTTLGRTLVSLERPTSGSVTYHGEDVSRLRGSARRRHARSVQFVFQDPNSSFDPNMTILASLKEPLFVQGLFDAEERTRRAQAALKEVGLNPEHSQRYPAQLSGGQKQRANIARALILEPDVLVADEAVSALDVSIQADILNMLTALQRNRGLSMVFISHDLAVIARVSHRVAVMYLGNLVEVGDAADLVARPQHPYTEALLSAHPEPVPTEMQTRERVVLKGDIPSPIDPPSGCRFHTRCPYADGDRCLNEVPTLRSVDGRLVACHYSEQLDLEGGWSPSKTP